MTGRRASRGLLVVAAILATAAGCSPGAATTATIPIASSLAPSASTSGPVKTYRWNHSLKTDAAQLDRDNFPGVSLGFAE